MISLTDVMDSLDLAAARLVTLSACETVLTDLAYRPTSAAVVKMDDFATAGEKRGDAGEIARVDICLHLRLDAGEAPGVEARVEALRFGSGDLCYRRVWRGHPGIVALNENLLRIVWPVSLKRLERQSTHYLRKTSRNDDDC
jgi:hypothetical protein